MKKTILFFTAALLLASAVSCNKNGSQTAVPEAPAGQFKLRIGIPEVETKALANSSTVKDFQINSAQVFVFDNHADVNDGTPLLETDYYYAPSSPASEDLSLTMNTTTGLKIIYVVVNREKMNFQHGHYTLGFFESELVDLAENSLTGFVMVGKIGAVISEYDQNKHPGQDPQILDVWVKRQVAMVLLSEVNVDFSNSSLSGASFRITQMYLKNAQGRTRLGLSAYTDEEEANVQFYDLLPVIHADGDNWYNMHTLTEGCPPILVDSDINISCNTSGTATSIGRCLFTSPNSTLPSQDSHSSAANWVPRLTRLTIKAHVTKKVNGISIDQDTFYTFDLPVLSSNKVYNIKNIHITQMGKDSDATDADVHAGRVLSTITVDPWDSDVIELSYEF